MQGDLFDSTPIVLPSNMNEPSPQSQQASDGKKKKKKTMSLQKAIKKKIQETLMSPSYMTDMATEDSMIASQNSINFHNTDTNEKPTKSTKKVLC